MKAIFKEKKKLVLNSADRNEQLVLEEFIKKANNGTFNMYDVRSVIVCEFL